MRVPRKTPWPRGGHCCAQPGPGRASQSIEGSSIMTFVKLYLDQGFFEIRIAAQAPPPSKVRKPTFSRGFGSLEKSAHRNLPCLPKWTKDQRRYIAVDWQVFYSIGPFAGPFSFLGFASCYFYQVFAVIPLQVYTDAKGPRFPTYSKASEFPIAQKKPVCVPGTWFLLGVKYVQRNFALDLFLLQRSCNYPGSTLSSSCLFCLDQVRANLLISCCWQKQCSSLSEINS